MSESPAQPSLEMFYRRFIPKTREQQQADFEAAKRQYEPPTQSAPATALPQQQLKEYKMSEKQQLEALQAQMRERGMDPAVISKVETKIEEVKTTAVVKQFYCRHTFNRVEAAFFGIPVRTKICTKCGLVK